MFIITQLLGLYVVNYYLTSGITLPYGFDPTQQIKDTPNFYSQFLVSFVFSLIIAIVLLLLLMKIQSKWIMKIWFFIVSCLAIGVTLNVFLSQMNILNSAILALVIAAVLVYFKIFRRDLIVHNFTELLIYPGIGVIFAMMFNLWTAIIVLILISIYDIWAVWKSGLMMKMVKYQMDNIGVMGGILIPYADKKIKEKIRLIKLKYQNKKIPEAVLKKSGIKIHLAVLGGGDMAFPIMAIGVFFKTFQSIPGTLIVIFFTALALSYILFFGDKKKPYPAMPYLTVGILLGMAVAGLLLKFF